MKETLLCLAEKPDEWHRTFHARARSVSTFAALEDRGLVEARIARAARSLDWEARITKNGREAAARL